MVMTGLATSSSPVQHTLDIQYDTVQSSNHAYDFLTVLNTIPDDLSALQKSEMTAFFQRELQTPTWLHALSCDDDDAMFSVRPDHQWTGAYKDKDELIDAIQHKLAAFPGITFNYTQPAEDAVDEALTGLKSSLDVKVFGTDLGLLEAKGRAIKKVLESIRGIEHVTLVQELGQPSLTIAAPDCANPP